MSTDAATEGSHWTSTVVLGDGETAVIRPLTPDDRPALLAFHERQSSESQYRRFFSPKPTLSDKELAHFTDVDMVDRAALAVEIRGEFIAWASYERYAGRDDAEAAFMVDDEHSGRGIATLLLEHLAAIARSHDVERFTAEVLAENRGMLAVFAKAGWPLQRRFESGVIDLDWELATTDDFLDSVERREQRADSRAVARIFFPRAVAVVGASDRAHSVGRLLWDHVRDSVDVPVYPVNPRLEDLDGHRCYGDVGDLPDDVSLALIAVPTKALDSTIDACIEKRMRGAVIVTAAHDDGPEGDAAVDVPALVTRARRNGLRIIGPSSMGVASLHDASRLQAALVDVTLDPGGVAISMQSGTLGASVLRRAQAIGLGVSWFVSLGDKSDVSANDLLQFWEDDENTRVVAIYTETLGNPRKFQRIARRVSRERPIVAVRTGAAARHDEFTALDQSAGLIEVPTVAALLDTCRVLSCQPVLRGPRVAVISNSPSPTTLTVAALEAAGLEPVSVDVPLDWRSDGEAYGRAIAAARADDGVDGIIVVYAPPIPAFQAVVAGAVNEAASDSPKPILAVMIGSEDGPITPTSAVPAFAFPEPAAATLGRSYGYARWLEQETQSAPEPARHVEPARAHDLIRTCLDEAGLDGEPHLLPVEDVGRLLASYGIEAARSATTSPGEAVEVAERIGYPVAIKSARRRPGRSVAAGLALDLVDADDVHESVEAMRASLGDDAGLLVVQEMTEPGINARVVCEYDEQVGVVVSVGYGGTDADIVADRSSRVAPLSPAAAGAALGETRVGAAIDEADFDRSRLIDLIVQASQLCSAHPEIDRLDLNPIVVSEDRAIVIDGSVRLVDRSPSSSPIRRL
ncbi:MAG: GNAT family N-acetyltransferase [Actinomycetota bacterium]